MAVRRERVVLDLESNLAEGLARDAVAARLLRGELDSLGRDSTKASGGLDRTNSSVDRTGTSFRKTGPEIDRFSGRLKAMRDAAILLGPALMPLGAAAIPLLTGSLAALGVASGGIAASVLALKGVGDAMKAIDAYQLDKTPANLQAVRVEMEKLGPAGADFARFLDSIEGELRTLQIAAREGLLPGLEDGITSALERLPGVRKIIREMAEGVGELARSAGADLAPGGDWDNFFTYLDTDGKAIMLDFGRGIGDIANGLADMLVAFGPLTRDFSNGFEGMAQSFADWAGGLDESENFEEFLDYIRINGPRAIDMLGSLVGALASITQAVAPVGAVTVPILTKFLDLIAALARSPLGTPFAAAVVGIVAYSRAVDVATAAQGKFNKMALANPYLIAAAVVFAAVTQIVQADDELVAATDRAQDALDTFNAREMRTELESLNETLEETRITMYPGDTTESFLGAFFRDGLNIGGLDVGDFVNGIDQASNIWTKFTGAAGEGAAVSSRLTGNLAILASQTKNNRGLAALFGETIGQTGHRMRIAAGDTQALIGALSELAGWFDKRQAIRDYNGSIRELSRSMRDGFTRQDTVNLDDIGQNMIKVASLITNPGKRAAFLENARAQLEALAKKGGPEAEKAVERIIRKMEALGLVEAKPKIDPDTKGAEQDFERFKREFDIMDALEAKPTISADASRALAVIRQVQGWLNGIPDEDVNINIKRHYSAAGAQGVGPAAINNESPRTTTPRTAGRSSAVPTSLTFGRTGDDKAAMYGGMFGGRGGGQDDAFLALYEQADAASQGLGALKRELKAATAPLSVESRSRRALVRSL